MNDDDVIDVSDRKDFVEKMRIVEKESICPCSKCSMYEGCMDPARCDKYRKWRKRWLKNATSW